MKTKIGDYEKKVKNYPTLILTHKLEVSGNGKKEVFFLFGWLGKNCHFSVTIVRNLCFSLCHQDETHL
jgi:hypothetical protein